MRWSRFRLLVGAASVVLLMGGCASSAGIPARQASDHFHEAFDSHDGSSACALLAPRTRSEVAQSAGKPCPQAVLEEKIPSVGAAQRVSVFGPDAQVRYATEAVFLSRYGGTWLVVAAGCTPVANDQYDCEVSGG